MTDPWADPNARKGREPFRNKGGRYELFHPETGKPATWSGATTVAKALSDTYHLDLWKQRMVVIGLGQREDLHALACGAKPEEKDKLNKIAADAMEAAGSAAGANAGTAIHSYTEAVDRGETPVIPLRYRPLVESYQQAMRDAGIKAVPGMIEVKVAIPELQVCGQLDRILAGPNWAVPRIGDVKSQKSMYDQVAIAVQLALYSRATHMWSHEADAWVEMAPVDQDWAVAMHMPSINQTTGQPGTRCEILDVDIATGWDLAKLCVRVRTTRSRRDLIRAYAPPVPVLARVMAAESVQELYGLYEELHPKGLWSPEVHEAGINRQKVLQSR